MANITDANSDGVKDIDDLSQSNVTLGGIAANSNASLKLSIAGDSTNNANLGGNDGIDFTLQVRTVVSPSWEDTDTSTNNTVQYNS